MGSSWLAGASPGAGRTGSSPSSGSYFERCMQNNNSAKSFWNRIKFDEKLDPKAFVVGYVDTQTKAQRKSGKDAWSERSHGVVVEEQFLSLLEQWGDNVPYHRLRFFKDDGVVVWVADGGRAESFASSSASTALRVRGSSPTTTRSTFDASGAVDGSDSDAEATSRPSPPADLPDDCWRIVASHLATRDICALSCCCTSTRDALHHLLVWSRTFKSIFGRPPEPQASADAVKLQCRVSELQASTWFHAPVVRTDVGLPSASCMVMDDSKVVSADGTNVRVWSPLTGKRFAVLRAVAPVTRLAVSERHVAAMEETLVRVWDIDDLKASRAMRCGQPLSDVCLYGQGMLLAAQRDGCVKVFDPDAQGQAVVMELRQAGGVDAVCSTAAGHVVTAGGALTMWDMVYGTEVVQLFDGSSEARSTLDSLFPCHVDHTDRELRFGPIAVADRLIAAATATFAALWDVRTANPVGLLPASTHPVWQHAAPAPPVGLFMDGYKLVVGLNNGIAVHDVRAVGSGACSGAWPRIAHVFGGPADDSSAAPLTSEDGRSDEDQCSAAPRRLQCMACSSTTLVAGSESGSCSVWALGRASASALEASCHGEDEDKRRRKEKKLQPPKRAQNRYPKRASR